MGKKQGRNAKLRELIESGDRLELAEALIAPTLGVLLRRHDDEDEAFTALPTAIKSLLTGRRRFTKGMSVRAWIINVIAAKVGAKKPQSSPVEHLPAPETAEELAEEDEIVDDVEGLLSALPEDQREALELIAVEGLSPSEAGKQLKVPSAVAEQRAERGLGAFAAAVKSLSK